jgi:hypothetical protein
MGNSEYYCRAAVILEVAAIALALRCVAKLVIRITVDLIIVLVWNPYLLNIPVTIWFNNLNARNVAWRESKDNVRVIRYTRFSRIRTRSHVTPARRNTRTVRVYVEYHIPLLASVSAGTDINLHVPRITSLIPDTLITQKEALPNRC